MTSAVERTGDCSTAAAPAFDDPRAAELLATVAELEKLARFDSGDPEQPADRAIAAARDLGLTELEQRAQLVLADLLRRRGNVAEAGRIAQDMHRWAPDHDPAHRRPQPFRLVARCSRSSATSRWRSSTPSGPSTLLGEDAAPAMRIDHWPGSPTAWASAATRPHATATPSSASPRSSATSSASSWCSTTAPTTRRCAGDFEAALDLSTQLQAVAARHDVPLHTGRLDTIARALMGLGRLEDAEAAMLPGLLPEVLEASLDGDAGADFLLTLAEVRRRLGHVADRAGDLDESVRRCEEYGLTSIRVRARREQAELHAAGGDFRAAFEEHKLYSRGADGPAVRRAGRPRAGAAGDVRDHRGPPADPPVPRALAARPADRPVQPPVRRRAAARGCSATPAAPEVTRRAARPRPLQARQRHLLARGG